MALLYPLTNPRTENPTEVLNWRELVKGNMVDIDSRVLANLAQIIVNTTGIARHLYTLYVDNVAYGDFATSLVTAKPGGRSPDWSQLADDGSGSRGVYCWHFPSNSITEVQIAVETLHGYKEGTAIVPHIHFVQPDGTAGKGIRWGLELTWIPASGAMPNTSFSGVTGITSALSKDSHRTDFPAIDGTGQTIDSQLVARIFRDTGHGDDDYAQSVPGLTVGFHYQRDSVGSQNPSSK